MSNDLSLKDNHDMLKDLVQTEDGSRKIVEALHLPFEMKLRHQCAFQYVFNLVETPPSGEDVVVDRSVCEPQIPMSLLKKDERFDLLDRAGDLALGQLLAVMTEKLSVVLDSRAVVVPELPKQIADKDAPGIQGTYLCGTRAAAWMKTTVDWDFTVNQGLLRSGYLGDKNGWRLVMSRYIDVDTVYMCPPLGDQSLKIETRLSAYGDLFGIEVVCVTTTAYDPSWSVLKWTIPQKRV